MAKTKVLIHTPFSSIPVDVDRYNTVDASDHIFWGVIHAGMLWGFLTDHVGTDVPVKYDRTPRGLKLRVDPGKKVIARWIEHHPDAVPLMTAQEYTDNVKAFIECHRGLNGGDYFEKYVTETIYGQQWHGKNSDRFWKTGDIVTSDGIKISVKGPRASLCSETALNQAETETK